MWGKNNKSKSVGHKKEIYLKTQYLVFQIHGEKRIPEAKAPFPARAPRRVNTDCETGC